MLSLSLFVSAAQVQPAWPFEENGGRFDPAVAYVGRTAGSDIFITGDGKVVHSLRGDEGARWTLVESMSVPSRPQPAKPASVPIHVFHGTTARRIGTYETIRFPLLPGVVSELRLRDGGVERVFELAPGASAQGIRVQFEGASSLVPRPGGGLSVHTAIGELSLSAPKAWQQSGDREIPVRVAYRVHGNTYSFALGPHDRRLPVIIDPLLQSTYVGGPLGETVHAIAPAADRVYVTGPASSGFPGTNGGAQSAHAGNGDAFVAAYSLDLTTMLGATYFGGTQNEVPWTVLATADAVYVGGQTESSNLPGTATGAFAAYAGGTGPDGFLARFSLDLSTLVRATYFGGTAREVVEGVAVSGSSLYATGFTQSATLPGTAGAAQMALSGTSDAFVARFSTDLTTLTRATFLGGSEDELTLSHAALTADSVYVVGTTNSHDFPNTAGGLQPALEVTDSSDAAFVSRLALDLSTITQSTFYATEFSHDRGTDIVSALGDVFILGSTAGDGLPGMAGGAFPVRANFIDAFVARLSPTLTSVVNASYFGGNSDETPGAHGLVVTAGNVYIAGSTISPTLPGTTGAIQPAKVGPLDTTSDSFVAGFSGDLTTLLAASFLGDPINEATNAITAIGGVLYLAGSEDSAGLPGATGGAQPITGGDTDGFISALTLDLLAAPPTPTVSISDVAMGEGTGGTNQFQFTVSISAPPASDATVTVQSTDGSAIAPGDFAALAPTILTFTPVGALSQTVTVQVVTDPDLESDESFTVNLSLPNGLTIADGVGTGTIVNDDASAAPVPTVPALSHTALYVLAALLGLAALKMLRL